MIPYIRGRFKSIPIEELLISAKKLVDSGVKELILVAQDVTKYGIEQSKKMLHDITNEAVEIARQYKEKGKFLEELAIFIEKRDK